MKNHIWKILLAVAVVLLGVSFWYASEASKKANEGLVLGDHVKGNSEAALSLVEYSDFQCPACQAASGVVAQVVDQYGDQIRFEYKHFPLLTIHRNALAAGVAAEAAGQQGKFWEMHDKLFAEQGVWGASASPTVYFVQYASELGLDVLQFKLQLGSSVLEQKVRSGFDEARTLGFTGTPTFVLNGQKMEFTSYADFISQVEAALGLAPEAVETVPDVQFGI